MQQAARERQQHRLRESLLEHQAAQRAPVGDHRDTVAAEALPGPGITAVRDTCNTPTACEGFLPCSKTAWTMRRRNASWA